MYREQLAAERDDLGKVDADPAQGAVIYAPQLRLETFAQRHYGAMRVLGQEAADLLVELASAKHVALIWGAEPLGERVNPLR
jgi:hypothetical protein